MQEIVKLFADYSTNMVIVILFIWDWVKNRKLIVTTLQEMATTNSNIEKCLSNMTQNEDNMAKSLELLQKSMEDQDWKLNKLLER